jgi:hypothetical protein
MNKTKILAIERHLLSQPFARTDDNLIQTFAKNMIPDHVPADGTKRTEIVCNNLLSEFEVRSVCTI